MAWLYNPADYGYPGNISIMWMQNGKPKKVTTGTKDKAQAEKILAEWIQENDKMLAQAESTGITFADVAEQYIFDPGAAGKRHTRKKSPATIDRYRKYFKSFLSFAGDDISIVDITPDVLNQFITWADQDGKLNMSTTQATVQRVGSVMRYAHKKGIVAKDISGDIAEINYSDREILKNNPRVVRAFTLDELRTIISVAHDKDPELEMIYVGLLSLGCRISELGTVTWQDVNFETEKILIHDAKRGGNVTRNVPINNLLMPYLKAAYDTRAERNHDHVFTLKGGRPATEHKSYDYIYNHLRLICKAHGINSGVRPHSFRYTFIQNYLRAGVNIKTIMTWVGHTRLETFEVYLNLFLDQSEDINKVSYSF